MTKRNPIQYVSQQARQIRAKNSSVDRERVTFPIFNSFLGKMNSSLHLYICKVYTYDIVICVSDNIILNVGFIGVFQRTSELTCLPTSAALNHSFAK